MRDLSSRGQAVVETGRGVVFARGALPGERVRLFGLRRVQGVLRAERLERLTRAPDRVQAPCAQAEACGGCPLMPLSIQAQRAWKHARVEHALCALFGPGLEVGWHAEGDGLGYRRRARLAWRRTAEEVQLGYRAGGSHALVRPARCVVLEPLLSRVWAELSHELAPHLVGAGQIQLARANDLQAAISLVSDTPQTAAAYTAAEASSERVSVAAVALRSGGASVPASWGRASLTLPGADGIGLESGLDGFAQANSGVNQRLVDSVVELSEARGAKLLELFAGHGNLTVALAQQAAELVAVESDPRAVASARRNLAVRGRRVRVVHGAAEAWVGRFRADVVVLDPPRAGAAEVCAALCRSRPKRVVYVSCDMATLRRDLTLLASGGYRPDAALAFDMFPHTAHVEALVRLTRASP